MKVPVVARAIIIGLIVGVVPANVWPVLLFTLGFPLGGSVEILFLGLYLWWASGNGPPRSNRNTRRSAFRPLTLSPAQWGFFVAVLFAAAIHAAIVFLFRLVPFPAESFR